MMRALALSLIAAALLHASAAGAEPSNKKLAVVELWAPPNLTGIAAKLTLDVQAVAETEGYQVVPPEQVQQILGAEHYKSLQACNGKSACVSLHASGLGAERMMIGTLDRNETSYLVKLFLVDLSGPVVVSSLDRSILIASRRLHSDVHDALPRLLRGEAEAKGKLTISTSAPSANLFFDDQPVGTTPFTIEAKPGKHTVRVEKANFLPIERFVTIEANGDERLSLLLTPVPGFIPSKDPTPSEAPREQKRGDASFSVPTASWIAGGVALAAVGAGAYFGLRAKGIEDRAGAESPYAITRNEAFEGKRDALIANVCFGAAGAAVLTGLVLAAVLPSDEAPPALTPSVGVSPTGASVLVGGSF